MGSELEVDHFQPRSRGGSNLVYACPACNRNKANYWPTPGTPLYRHLLHPQVDDLDQHIRTLNSGYLEELTQRGKFHIEWLHLNRQQLIIHRQQRLLRIQLEAAVNQLRNTNQKLNKQISQQRDELLALNQRIRDLQDRL